MSQDPVPSKPPMPTKRFVAIGFLGMALLILFAGIVILAAPGALDRARPGTAAVADGVQTISVEVANGVYAPNVLRVKPGIPLRLHVRVREKHSCATKILVPDLKLDFDLPPAGDVDLMLPAMKPGTYLFTCGRKMVKGTIVVE